MLTTRELRFLFLNEKGMILKGLLIDYASTKRLTKEDEGEICCLYKPLILQKKHFYFVMNPRFCFLVSGDANKSFAVS